MALSVSLMARLHSWCTSCRASARRQRSFFVPSTLQNTMVTCGRWAGGEAAPVHSWQGVQVPA
jgi:hypothetical protein